MRIYLFIYDKYVYWRRSIGNPIRAMMVGNGRNVREVIVDGHTIIKDNQISGLDVGEMRAAYPERDHLRRPVDVLVAPSFRQIFKST